LRLRRSGVSLPTAAWLYRSVSRSARPTMSAAPFTPEWTQAFREAINSSATYRENAEDWAWPLALCLLREPTLGYPEDVAILLELDRGHCRSARLLPAGQANAPFLIRGDYPAWKKIVRGEVDPVSAIVAGSLRIEGSLSTIMLHVRSAKALVECASTVPTFFPDEEPYVA
jgi:putative sterol carrier protein